MSLLDDITVLILTHNEEDNIGRTLAGVAWAKRIVVVDSGSTDNTVNLVSGYPQSELVRRPFDNHQAQWNFGLDVCEGAKWILALDADYILGDAVRRELAELSPSQDVNGYRAFFDYCIHGRRLRGTLYPPITVLYRRDHARYVQKGHTQCLLLKGQIGSLQARILHDDRKPLARWLASQQKYARLEAAYLLSAPRAEMRRSDRLRLMGWPAPLLVFFYTLIAKRCILDGWPGWLYVLQRTLTEAMISVEVVDRKLHARRSETGGRTDG